MSDALRCRDANSHHFRRSVASPPDDGRRRFVRNGAQVNAIQARVSSVAAFRSGNTIDHSS